MDKVQPLIDSVKSLAYELLALLLPGATLLVLGQYFAGTPVPPSAVPWIGAAYVLGLALQGGGAWLGRTRGARVLIGGYVDQVSSAEQRAKEIVTTDFGASIASEHLLDVAITRAQPHRQVYDKFLALTDTTRGLALVMVLAVGLACYGARDHLDEWRSWLPMIGLVAAWGGFCERYRRFAPVASKALYATYITLQFDAARSATVVSAAEPPTAKNESTRPVTLHLPQSLRENTSHLIRIEGNQGHE